MLVVVTRLFVFIVIITFLCNIVAKILTDCGTSAMLAISRVAFATKKQITNWRCAAAVTSQGESLQCVVVSQTGTGVNQELLYGYKCHCYSFLVFLV